MRFHVLLFLLISALPANAENWPRWRGPDGNGFSVEVGLPVTWSATENVVWKTPIPGEGMSSPVVWDDRVFLTSAEMNGTRRNLHCFDRKTGKLAWTRSIDGDQPGHAAPTPVTDGIRVVASFGNGGLICCSLDGKPLWSRELGEFSGLTSSPIIHGEHILLVCDHDGEKPRSFVIAIDKRTGKDVWKTDRPKLAPSPSAPIVVRVPDLKREVIVAARHELSSYDPKDGKHLWTIDGLSNWTMPTPIYGLDSIICVSGKNGPIIAAKTSGKGKVELVWRQPTEGPNALSPLLFRNYLFVPDESGLLSCFDAILRKPIWKEKLEGKFSAPAVQGEKNLYVSNEAGRTYVVKTGSTFELLAKNDLGEAIRSSPAISHQCLFIRGEKHLWCIGKLEK